MQVVVPELSVIELPYLYNTRDEAAYVWNQFFDHMNKQAEKKNLLFTCLMEVGWWDFYTREKVTTREELTRIKTETIGGDVFISTHKHWDIPIVIVPPAESLPALQTGVFDAVNAPIQYLIGAQAFTEVPYCLKAHWLYQHATVAMNKKRLDRVPEDLKKVFLEEMKNFAKEVIPATRKSNDDVWNNMEKYGVTIVEPSPAVLKDFKEKSRPVWDDLVDKCYSRSLLNDVIKTRDEYRRKIGGEKGGNG
jgi:TRAP-type C4-dicarboxylate transport system substrate-binding protein